MPVARIYASLVEEAEPICADLLARGYNVEIVFPDAILPTPADLELRVERCSAEQAIARVEAGGSPSRCVFVTPAKGPARELLLVEMTVLATGTNGRHPISLPGLALVTGESSAVPLVSSAVIVNSSLAEVLPFPGKVDSEAAEAIAAAENASDAVSDSGSDVEKMEQDLRRRLGSGPNLSGHLIAELNAFLAHAPVVERPDGLHVRIYENVRQSAGVKRAQKNWEGLTLAGVAASLVLLTALGWYAAPERPKAESREQSMLAAPVAIRPAAIPPVAIQDPSSGPTITSAIASSSASSPSASIPTQSILIPSASAPVVPVRLAAVRHRLGSTRSHRKLRLVDDLVARDQVSHVNPAPARQVSSADSAPRPATAATTSELVRPPAIRSSPIRIITDLK